MERKAELQYTPSCNEKNLKNKQYLVVLGDTIFSNDKITRPGNLQTESKIAFLLIERTQTTFVFMLTDNLWTKCGCAYQPQMVSHFEFCYSSNSAHKRPIRNTLRIIK